MQFQNTFVPSAEVPFVSIPAQGKIRAGYLRGLVSIVRDLGGDPLKALEDQELDPRTFEDPDQDIECLAAANLLEYCSRLLRDPLFGLRLAEQQDPDVFGCVMALARAAPNMRRALQSLIEHVSVSTSPECEFEMVTAREVVELRWRTSVGVGDNEQVYYHGLLLIMKTLQMLGRQDFHPSYATLTFRVARADIHTLEDRLGCRIYGKAQADAIAFPVDVLDRPIATSNKMLFTLLGSSLAQLRAASKASLIERLEASVRLALPTGCCSLSSCAEKLGTSTRTLQKRLARTGVTFLDIVQNERIKLAKQALRWSDCTLDEIAFQLGYTEQSSFGRAFKRATGVTPHAFRLEGNRDL